MERIFHPYWLWEDHINGFYETDNKNKNDKIKSVLKLFSSEYLTRKYMDLVLIEWVYSCEHNLTNPNLNKVAYIGQAACCLFDNVPSLVTMNAWKMVDVYDRIRSDEIANQTINKWIQNQKSRNISKNGNQEAIQKGYQTRLHFV